MWSDVRGCDEMMILWRSLCISSLTMYLTTVTSNWSRTITEITTIGAGHSADTLSSASDFIFLASSYENGWPVLTITSNFPTDSVRSAYNQCMVSIQSLYGYCMASVQSVHGQCMMSIQWVYGQHTISVHTISVQSLYGQRTISTITQYATSLLGSCTYSTRSNSELFFHWSANMAIKLSLNLSMWVAWGNHIQFC